MELALVQQSVGSGTVDANRGRAVEGVERAVTEGADLVVLPELFATGYFAFDAYQRTAEPLAGPTHETVAALAREHDVTVLAGTVIEDLAASREAGWETPAPEGLANTAVLIDPDGEIQSVYRKRHLFGYDSAEVDLLEPGERHAIAEVGAFTVGITTCYDLRFPEQYRTLVDRGVDLVLVPSAWPYPRVEHWQVLPRARAVENLAYVAAANGVGTFEDAELLGRSAVYDPWGVPVASAGDEATVITATLDHGRVESVRSSFPALDDRR